MAHSVKCLVLGNRLSLEPDDVQQIGGKHANVEKPEFDMEA